MQDVTKTTKIKTESDRLWSQFKTIFWILFVLHLGFKYLPRAATTEDEYIAMAIAAIVLNLLVAIAMAINVGWHSYKFRGKKIHLLKGLLGFFWFATIGIFIAFFTVRDDYKKAAKDNTNSLKEVGNAESDEPKESIAKGIQDQEVQVSSQNTAWISMAIVGGAAVVAITILLI